MELKLLLTLLRRWAWLLIIGALLGAGGAYLASNQQETIYQATTKVMVIRPQESSVTASITQNDQELAQTYIALITTQPVLAAASERLGFAVRGGQVSARQTAGTRLLEVTVRANEAPQAALIANTLVEVLIERNNELQSSRFAVSEESLQAQINQVEEQINQLQSSAEATTADGNHTVEREALEAELARQRVAIINLEQEIADLTAAGLTPAEQAQLLDVQIELSELKFNLTIEENIYNARLAQDPDLQDPETEARILAWQRDVLLLEQEIEMMRAAATAQDPETRQLLAEKRAELAQKQVDLTFTEQQYLALLSASRSAGDGLDPAEQNRRQASLSLYQQLYANLLSTYESVRLARLQNTPNLIQVEAAGVPGSPIQPRPMQSLLLGLAVGLIVMGSIAFVIEYMDDTLKTPADFDHVLHKPVLGFIADTDSPREDGKKWTLVAESPRSPTAEAFRTLRTNLEFAGVEKPLRTILITSPGPADGKTTVATNLAESMAQTGKRVVVVDADLRRPFVHRFLNLPNRFGLSDLFREQMNIADASQSWPDTDGRTDVTTNGQESGLSVGFSARLSAITSGALPPNPAELLGSKRMDQLLAELREVADVVIIDSPPLLVSDAAVLSAKVDGVILVMQPGETSISEAQGVLAQLQRAEAHIVGVVLNRIPRQRGYGSYYYYTPYYYADSYYNGDGSKAQADSRQTTGKIRRMTGRIRSLFS
jgi:polysaccharide biosynthesis transport protein